MSLLEIFSQAYCQLKMWWDKWICSYTKTSLGMQCTPTTQKVRISTLDTTSAEALDIYSLHFLGRPLIYMHNYGYLTVIGSSIHVCNITLTAYIATWKHCPLCRRYTWLTDKKCAPDCLHGYLNLSMPSMHISNNLNEIPIYFFWPPHWQLFHKIRVTITMMM